MTESARTGRQRKADTIAKLEAIGADTWVATAATTGMAHLVPLSYAWSGECVVLAAEASSVTVRNVRSSGRARLGFGPTRDVVIVDGELDRLLEASDGAAEETARAYADQAGWIRGGSPNHTSSSSCGLVACKPGVRRTSSRARSSCATASGCSRLLTELVELRCSHGHRAT
jgi:hypothetical protein